MMFGYSPHLIFEKLLFFEQKSEFKETDFLGKEVFKNTFP